MRQSLKEVFTSTKETHETILIINKVVVGLHNPKEMSLTIKSGSQRE